MIADAPLPDLRARFAPDRFRMVPSPGQDAAVAALVARLDAAADESKVELIASCKVARR